jgi:hypothetical protein
VTGSYFRFVQRLFWPLGRDEVIEGKGESSESRGWPPLPSWLELMVHDWAVGVEPSGVYLKWQTDRLMVNCKSGRECAGLNGLPLDSYDWLLSALPVTCHGRRPCPSPDFPPWVSVFIPCRLFNTLYGAP